MKIGDIQVDAVIDGIGRAPVAFAWKLPAASGEVPRGSVQSDWAGHEDFLDADGLMAIPAGGFLVRHHDRVVLIDTGKGPLDESPVAGEPWPKKFLWQTGALFDNLMKLGVAAQDVTDVLFTHLHTDHTGWASMDGRATFPKATYRCDRRDWQHFLATPGKDADPRIAPLMMPVEDQMECWDGDGPLLPGIDLLRTPGHTPGSTVMVISASGRRALVLGDAVHCPVQLLENDWAAMGDFDPNLARRAREMLAREVEDGETVAAGPHFPGMEFGRIVSSDVRRSWLV